MKPAFERLVYPYLDGELEIVAPAKELTADPAHVIGKSPFGIPLELREAEPVELPQETELDSLEREQEQSDEESDLWTPESEETEQSLDDEEDFPLAKRLSFEGEAEQWVQGGD